MDVRLLLGRSLELVKGRLPVPVGAWYVRLDDFAPVLVMRKVVSCFVRVDAIYSKQDIYVYLLISSVICFCRTSSSPA